MFIIKIANNLDPNLKFFLNSLKTALLMRTVNLRLVIIEGEKIVAGQNASGKKVAGCQTLQFADLVHFLTPFQFEEQAKCLMNGSLLLCHKQSINVEVL